jgi:hypothetical protein
VVATVVFTDTGRTRAGQTASVSGDANLGTIIVSPSTGAAVASMPSTMTLVTTTPSGAACPAGTWRIPSFIPSFPCQQGAEVTATVFVAPTPSGKFETITMIGPVNTPRELAGS